MSGVRNLAAVVSGLAILVLAVGCAPGPKDLQIQSLQEKLAGLGQEKADLMARLAAALDEADAARARQLELQRLLNECERKLAEKPVVTETLPPAGWQETGDIAWTNIADDILFDSGKADLKPEGRTKLGEIATTIRQEFAGRDIWIVGHTDNDPIKVSAPLWKDNLDLSQGRARAVALELMALGIDGKDLVAGGQGQFNPVAPNDSKANKALNRRVQIIAVRTPALDASAPGATERG